MTFLILQMLGLLILAAFLGWLIGRWKVTTLLAERDEIHESRMRSRFKKIEELKASLNNSQVHENGVDLEVHRMLEDRFHQLKQDNTRVQQTLREHEVELRGTKERLEQREQSLRDTSETLNNRELKLESLLAKEQQAQTLLVQAGESSAAELESSATELENARTELLQVREQLSSAEQGVRIAEKEAVDHSKRIEQLEKELSQAADHLLASEKQVAEQSRQLSEQDTSASLDAAVADGQRWRDAHDAANEKVSRVEAQLAEVESQSAEMQLKNEELTETVAQLRSSDADREQAQNDADQLRDELAILGAAKAKADHNIDVLKQVYYRMRNRFRDADSRALAIADVSQEQAAAVAEDSAVAAELRREKLELQERLEKSEVVASKLRAEFSKRFMLAARLQETLKAQQAQLSGAQMAIGRYEKAEAASRATLKSKERSAQEQAKATSAADNMISVLKSTVSKQRDRLALCREGIDEMQQLLNADLSQAERVRRQRHPGELSKVAANHPDNLQRIKGVGWRKEARLRSLGIERYSDMARLSADDALWLDQVMGLDGAVQRQDWIGQSRKLAAVGAGHGPQRAEPAAANTSIDRPISRVSEPGARKPKGRAG